jgi:mycoredoxin
MIGAGSWPQYGRRIGSQSIPIVVYGTRWCAATQRVRRYLERLGVPYDFVDLDRNSDAKEQLRWLTGGYASHPTIYIGGEVLVEPTLEELEWALSRSGAR